MRSYMDLSEAISEIKRDVAKGSKLEFSRVQQRTGLHLQGRERLMYDYCILGGFPDVEGLIELGKEHGLKFFVENAQQMKVWLLNERLIRITPQNALKTGFQNELNHPALKTTIEGNHPSYTYQELLMGMRENVIGHLQRSPDSRRAYWPLFKEVHAIRAPFPTRIPCSLGYQFMLREVPNQGQRLFMFYLQRSADFDTFLLSDLWLAREVQKDIAAALKVEVGPLFHSIISLHSFDIDGQEVY